MTILAAEVARGAGGCRSIAVEMAVVRRVPAAGILESRGDPRGRWGDNDRIVRVGGMRARRIGEKGGAHQVVDVAPTDGRIPRFIGIDDTSNAGVVSRDIIAGVGIGPVTTITNRLGR